ncbi:MAG: PQQ-binding-like beta-propeller repeat protein [Spongiibacteraceae bacterium]
MAIKPTKNTLLLLLALCTLSFMVKAETTNNDATHPVRSGADIYSTICAQCHEAGVPKAPSKSMLGFISPSVIYRALTEGVMRNQAAMLSLEEKSTVAEYISGRKFSAEALNNEPLRCEQKVNPFDANTPPALQGWGFTPDNRREIPTDVAGIDTNNVGTLSLKWVFAFPDAVRARSHPATAAGAVFVGSQDGTVYSLDRETGCMHWSFKARAEVRTGIVVAPWDSQDLTADPLLYFGDFLGNVYALRARTGQQVWTRRVDSHQNATITGTPTLFEDRLYVPVSSLEVTAAVNPDYACCSFRGSVVALAADSGKQHWKTYTIAEQPSPQAKNKNGVMQYGPSGAPIWNTPSIDSQRRTLYVGTGENYSSPAGGTSDAIIAINLDDGAIKWVFQATKGDAWNASCVMNDRINCPEEDGPDFDFGGATILAQGDNGKQLLLAGQKSGTVWALNPDDGKLVWRKQVGRGGIIGGIHFGMAVSGTSLIVPISDALADAAYPDRYSGTPNPGLFALDIDTGDFLWKWQATDVCNNRPYCVPGNSAVPTATPELVIAGSMDGYLRIHDASTGKLLWQYNTAIDFPNTVSGIPGYGGSLEGGTAALLDNGMLFINSGYMFSQHMPGNVLLAFEIKPPQPSEPKPSAELAN